MPHVIEHSVAVPVKHDAKTTPEDYLAIVNARTPGKTDAGSKVISIRLKKLFVILTSCQGGDGPANRAVDKPQRPEHVVTQNFVSFGEGGEVLPAKAEVDRQIGPNLPVILHENTIVAVAEVTLTIERPAGWIHLHLFIEAASVI